MPRVWDRTPEQTAYLRSFYEPFLTARRDQRLELLRADMNQGWFERWPEQIELWPSWQPGSQLTVPEVEQLGRAIAKRKAVSSQLTFIQSTYISMV